MSTAEANTIDPNTNSAEMSEGAFSETLSGSDTEIYQSVARSAVASIILAVFGLLAFWFAPLTAISVLGLVFAILALRAIARFPEELQGKNVAFAGGALSLITCIAAPALHTYTYLTEVPDGYTRLDFAKLKSPKGTADVPPQTALQYNGEKVFIKGYIHPASMDNLQSKKFVLVPDLGTCCFGTQPPLTHMIEVKLSGDQYAQKGFRKQRLAGTLRINPELKPVEELQGVFYQLRADILK